jgi:hypothetical protein
MFCSITILEGAPLMMGQHFRSEAWLQNSSTANYVISPPIPDSHSTFSGRYGSSESFERTRGAECLHRRPALGAAGAVHNVKRIPKSIQMNGSLAISPTLTLR